MHLAWYSLTNGIGTVTLWEIILFGMEIKVSVISIGNDTAISLPNSAAKERESLTKRKKGLLIYTVLIRLC